MPDFANRLLRSISRRYRRWSGRVALNNLDRKLGQFLDCSRGFFIEAGANDGINQSNTLYLEKRKGWTGLLIEPLAEPAARCRQNRPGCIVEHCALVSSTFADSHVIMRDCNLMSLVKGSRKTEQEELDHIALGCTVQQITPREELVPARTLSSLLDQHKIQQVDLLSLDVEGSELEALKGIDFTRHRPRWMLIEARHRSEIDAYLHPWYEAVAELSEHDVLYRAR